MRHSQTGSWLVEIGIVVMLCGVVALVAMRALSDGERARGRADNTTALEVSEQALRAYVLRQKRLPCPDSSGTGYEDRNAAGVCNGSAVGQLPYLTLQLDKPVLAAGQSLRYGYWRDGSVDLANPAAVGLGGDEDLSVPFLDALARAASTDIGTSRPYVAKAGADGDAIQCDSAGSNPAFVLAALPAETSGPAHCFRDSPSAGFLLLSVGPDELRAWVRSRIAH